MNWNWMSWMNPHGCHDGSRAETSSLSSVSVNLVTFVTCVCQFKASLSDTMAAVAFDNAPGLTTVNQLWWMMDSDKIPAIDHALANYYNAVGYYKGPRNEQHLKFHSEAAPAGSECWGKECAARAMPLIAPEFYNRTGKDFSKDVRHRLMEAFFYSLSKLDNQELYQHAVATTSVLSDLQRSPWYVDEGSPEITDLAALLELRTKFVEKLKNLRAPRLLQFWVLKALPAQQLCHGWWVTSNFWWVQSRADLDLESNVSDGSRADFLISIGLLDTPTVSWRMKKKQVEEWHCAHLKLTDHSHSRKTAQMAAQFSVRQVWTCNAWRVSQVGGVC